MTDTLTPAQRSERMSRIKGSGTLPELLVRWLLSGLGYRYKLGGYRLPGRPDVVFPGRRKVLFVHGCFWHRHAGCSLARMPKSRETFWAHKFSANQARDERTIAELRDAGWQVHVVWECSLRDLDELAWQLIAFLEA